MPKKRFHNNGLGMLFVSVNARISFFCICWNIVQNLLQFSMWEISAEICFWETFLTRPGTAEFRGRSSRDSKTFNALTQLLSQIIFIFLGTICVQHSYVHPNLFYCSDSVDLAERDARLLLICFCFFPSSKESTMRERDLFITIFGTSGVKVERGFFFA